MMMPSLRHWFGRSAQPPSAEFAHEPVEVAPVLDLPVRPAGPKHLWTPERIQIADRLWGEGFQFPGGDAETLRLAKPLGLSAASTLLLLGAGSGGAACSVATNLGVWVSGFEADPDLVVAAANMISRTKLGRRAQVERWEPANPSFPEHYYHHGLALEPLRGHLPEMILAAITAALKPGGQLVLVEVVADTPLDPTELEVSAWARIEQRKPEVLPSTTGITRILGRLGFDVRICEDISNRHIQQAIMGWRRLVREMETERRPNRETALLVAEAELWLLRVRLFRNKRLRLVRWHAISRGTVLPAATQAASA
jgi:hypothetical protein